MKKAIMLVALGFILFTSLFTALDPVKGQYVSTNVQVTYGSLKPFVNQRVEFTATCVGGTPPYTYQWFTQLWSTWKPGMSYNLSPITGEDAVPGATSNVFDFTPLTNGTYSITLGITDSEGKYTLASFLPGLWVFVSLLPTSTLPPVNPGASQPPTITITSPTQNSVYKEDVALNFTLQTNGEFPNPYDLNSTTSWGIEELSYSLDGNANVTISGSTMNSIGGNTTLTGLPEGDHWVVVYAKRWLYYGIYYGGMSDSIASSPVHFRVESSVANAQPSGSSVVSINDTPVVSSGYWIIIITVIVAPFIVGLGFNMIKKRKNKRLLSSEL